MIIPGTAKGIIERIRRDYQLSARTIAHLIKMAPKTIYQILHGKTPDPTTDFQLLCFYLKLKLLPNKKNRKNYLVYVKPKNINSAIAVWR